MKNKKTRTLTLTLVILLILGGLAYLFLFNESPTSDKSDGIDYGLPSESQLEDVNRNKQKIVDEANNDTQSSQENNKDKTKVKPVVSFWGQQSKGADFELNGYVEEVIERDGTCTLTLRNNTHTASTKKHALPDAQNTSCGLMVIPFSDLTAGNWIAVLSYESTSSSGSSEPINVTVN